MLNATINTSILILLASISHMSPIRRFPAVFVNHGGGPMPLMGAQPEMADHMKEVRTKWLPKEKPSAIVVFSAHWESDPIHISSAANPSMYFDYYGFPKETYSYEYPAPGNPALAQRIQALLKDNSIEAQLSSKRGYDHGVFVPLMLMYPEAEIPVVCVSLHSSLSAKRNMEIGRALAPLRDESILFVGSGLTFHNMAAFGNPSGETYRASSAFNDWLKETIMGNDRTNGLEKWERAPGARSCHKREEHLLPLFMVAASSPDSAEATVIFDRTGSNVFSVSAYMFS